MLLVAFGGNSLISLYYYKNAVEKYNVGFFLI